MSPIQTNRIYQASVHNSIMRMMCLVVILTAGTLCLCAGCAVLPTHLHSDANATTATHMQTTMETISKNEPSIYQSMLNNLAKFSAEEDIVISQLVKARQSAFILNIPFETLEDLKKEHERVANEISKSDLFLRETTKAYLNEQKLATSDLDDTKKMIGKAQDALKQAKEDLTHWNATVAALQGAAAQLPTLASSVNGKKESTADGLKATYASLGQLGAQEVQYVDADGVSQKKKILDILKDGILGDSSKSGTFNIPEAPGIQITIVTIALDLAQIQKERAANRLHEISRRFQLFGETFAQLRLAEELMGVKPSDAEHQDFDTRISYVASNTLPVHSSLNNNASAVLVRQQKLTDQNAPVGDARITELKEINQDVGNIQNGLISLRYLALADAIDTRTQISLKLTMARYDHEDSILQSRLNDRAWSELLKGGIDGLTAYHDGGFSADDAATVTRVLQTAALAVIASN